jgi:hypothetical protein
MHRSKEQRMQIKTNVGGFDRVLRIMVGLVMVIATIGDVIGSWGYLGLVVMATGLFSFCGAYTVFGINTCPAPHHD